MGNDTTARLAAIRARCEASTPGPWEPMSAKDGRNWFPQVQAAGDLAAIAHGDATVIAVCKAASGEFDIEFIASGRTDLPWAVALVERYEAALVDCVRELHELREVYDTLRKAHDPNWVTYLSWSIPGARAALAGQEASRE